MLNDFIAWVKNPNPDTILLTILLKYWRRNRSRAKVIKNLDAKQQEEGYQQIVAHQAYLLWEADGKPEGKDDYYWELALASLQGNHFPSIYQPYYKLEKQVLEPIDAWIDKQAFFSILGKLGNLAVVVAIVTFVFGENVRRNNEVFAAWQTITSAHGQSGSGGRIKALEFLNSRPLRFPWIGWTRDWFWDEKTKECQKKLVFGRRWSREPLVGLSAPNSAYLSDINLCDANLERANLQQAILWSANLQQANLYEANLQQAFLLGAKLKEAHLYGINLQKAVLWGVNLQETNLVNANLQQAILYEANLQQAILWSANLQQANLYKANLYGANLQQARNLTHTQIKSACFWEQAIYQGEWNSEEKTYVPIEPDNTNYIEKLKQDIASNPRSPINCRRWQQDTHNNFSKQLER